MKHTNALCSWLLLLICAFHAQLVVGQRGEPFTITSLIPDQFPPALTALKNILVNEITERGEDVAEALGATEIVDAATDYVDDFTTDMQEKFEAVADFLADPTMLDNLALIVQNAMDEYSETVSGITKFCDASSTPTVRRLLWAQTPWDAGYDSTMHVRRQARRLTDEETEATIEAFGQAVNAGSGLAAFQDTLAPTSSPTYAPTSTPTKNPTSSAPTASPSTPVPTGSPITLQPSSSPSLSPTGTPTKSPTTMQPTSYPTTSPTFFPTSSPEKETCLDMNNRIAERVADRPALTVGLGVGLSGTLEGEKIQGSLSIGFGAEIGATIPARQVEGYFSWSAGFSFGAVAVDCQKGYYCNNSGVKTLCPPGYYCPVNTSGTPTLRCAEGYYCPQGSTTSQGKSVLVGTCGIIDTKCACNTDGTYCPTGSTTSSGAPVSTVDDCTAGTTCTCQAGYFCSGGVRERSAAGYYIDATGQSTQDLTKKCDEGYFCPETSTSSKGEPVDGSALTCQDNQQCKCKAGYFCPETSKTKTGEPAENFVAPVNEGSDCGIGDDCECSSGYACVETSTRSIGKPVLADLTNGCSAAVACPCEAGYYCLDKSTSSKGKTSSQPVNNECGEGYYCPATSTSTYGRPAVLEANCAAGDQCKCASTYFCPEGSTDNHGTPVKKSDAPQLCEIGNACTCPAGYYCKDGDITECPAGLYCLAQQGDIPSTKCEAGSYCPEGSTVGTGKPISDYQVVAQVKCQAGQDCTCEEGYWCPEQSTMYKGRPSNSVTISDVSCGPNSDCDCKAGYYCPTGSKTPLGVTSSDTSEKQCTVHHYCPKTSTDGLGKPAETQAVNSFTCTKSQACECPAGTECPVGSAEPSFCPKGYGCPKASARVNCLAGYFCPAKSTTNKGEPIDSVIGCGVSGSSGTGTCECGLGNWCPEGSTTRHGEPIASKTVDLVTCNMDARCECGKGYYCPYSSTSPLGKPVDGSLGDCTASQSCKCAAGYYCPASSARPDGGATTADLAKKCGDSYFCPETSTESTGKPIDTDPNCASGAECDCDATFFCPTGSTEKSGKPVEAVVTPFECSKSQSCPCPAGHFCEAKGQSKGTNGVPTQCDAGYYCTEGSDSATQNDCDAGRFCPAGSTTGDGKPVDTNNNCLVNTQVCKCEAGYWCPARSTDKRGNPATPVTGCTNNCDCDAGYYCPSGSLSKLGQLTLNGAESKCAEGFYCPSTSTTDQGKPAETETNCAQGAVCTCKATTYCPETSTTHEGRPVEQEAGNNPCSIGAVCTCREGNVCDDGTEVACPLGYYCPAGSTTGTAPKCDAGYFCPAGSTTAKGNPITSTIGCGATAGDGIPNASGTGECKCQGGYYCPETSTSPKGRPAVALVGGVLDQSSCAKNAECGCTPGSWCPPTSTSEIGKPVVSATGCVSGDGCFTDPGYFSDFVAYKATGDSLFSPFPRPCKPGYFCRSGATKDTGADVLLGCPLDLCYCAAGSYCPQGSGSSKPSGKVCQISYWCPEGSTSQLGRPVKNAPGCATGGDCCVAQSDCPCATGSCTLTGSTSPTSTRRLESVAAEDVDESKLIAEAKAAYRGRHDSKAIHMHEALTREASQPTPTARKLSAPPVQGESVVRKLAAELNSKKQQEMRKIKGDLSREGLMKSATEYALEQMKKREQKMQEVPPVLPTHFVDSYQVDTHTRRTNSVRASTIEEAVESARGTAGREPIATEEEKRELSEVNNNTGSIEKDIPGQQLSSVHGAARNLKVKGKIGFGASLGVTFYFNPFKGGGFSRLDSNPLSGFSGYDVTVSRDAPFLTSFSVGFNSNYYQCIENDSRTPSGLGFFKDSYVALVSLGLVDFDFTQSPVTTFNEIKSAFSQFFSRSFNFQGLQIGFNIGGGFNTEYFERQSCLPDRDRATLKDCDDVHVFRRRLEQGEKPRIRGGSVAQKIVDMAKPIESKPIDEVRGRELTTAVDEYLELAQNVLEDGPITRDFCFGDCTADVSSNRNIQGSIVVQATPACDGVQFIGTVPTLSLGGLIFTGLNELDPDVATKVVEIMGPFGGAGVSDAQLVLSFTTSSLELTLTGSPLLPNLSGIIDDELVLFIYDEIAAVAASANIGVRGKLNGISSAEFELFVFLDPDLDYDKPVGLVSKSLPPRGPKVFALARVSGPYATPTLELSVGLSITVRVCVNDCGLTYGDATRLDAFFTGVIETKIIAGPNPATTIGGALILENSIPNFLGLSFLNVGSAVLATSFNPLTFPVPASILVGASVCLGSETNCLLGGNGPIIRAAAYLGLDQNVPDKNYFVAMFSEVTFDSVLAVLGDTVDSELETLRQNLPSWLRDTGIMPYDITKCASFNSTPPAEDELASTTAEPIDINCYAYVSVAPFAEVPDIIPQTTDVELSLKRGITISGEVNLFNQLKFRVNALVDIFAPPAFTLEIDVDMERFTFFDDFIQIGKEIQNGEAVGGASFYFLASNQQLAFQLYIEAAIAIPLIKTTGSLDVQVDDLGFGFDGQLSIFGLVNSQVIVDLPWDFSSFYLKITNVPFSPLLVIENLEVNLTPDPARFKLAVAADITVLFFAQVSGDFTIERNGDNLDVDFTVTGKTGLVDATVEGSASVDLVDILDTDFGEFKVTFSPGAALEAAVEFVKDVGKAISDGVGQALDAGKNLVKDIGNFINKLDTQFIENSFGSFKDGINNLLSGNFEDSLASFGTAFKTIFKPSNWEDLSLSFLDALGILSEDRGAPYAISERDQFECNYLRQTIRTEIRTNVCKSFGFNCGWKIKVKTEESDKFQNDTCVEEKQEIIRNVRNGLTRATSIQDSRVTTQNTNAGLIKLNETGIDFVGDKKPQFDQISTTVPSSNGFPTRRRLEQQNKVVNLGVSFKKLTNSASDDGFASGSETKSQSVALDFSSESAFASSLSNAAPSLGQTIAGKVYEDMSGISPELGSFTGVETELQPLQIDLNAALLFPPPFTCLEAGTAAQTVKPYVSSFDTRCANGDVNNIVVKPKIGVRQSSANPSHPCGSWIQTVEWTAEDFCQRTSNSIFVEITVLNIAPSFDQALFPSDPSVSTDANILDTDIYGEPTVISLCKTNEVYIDYVDGPFVPTGNCGEWTMERTWRTRNFYGDVCQDQFVEQVQTYTIADTSAPVFKHDVPSVVRIDFFDNFDVALPAPIVADEAGNGYLSDAGITSGGVVLTSTDTNFVMSNGDLANEATCRTDGIASFTRTWTAADACGNALSKTQTVFIDHPAAAPETPSTAGLFEPEYAGAIGVLQRTDTCLPGKDLNLGIKTVNTENMAQELHDCAGSWDQNGCRLLTEDNTVADGLALTAIGPYFSSFPVDVDITTGDVHYPNATGSPEGAAFCGTPWEIVYNDEAPVEIECGVWTIDRVWTIIPVYSECARVPLDSILATNQTQVLTIRDVTPPVFNSFPDPAFADFLTDYGTTTMGSPTVQDIAPNAALEALGLNSYPVSLGMSDILVEFPDPYQASGSCVNGLATVTRKWTVSDRCGTSQDAPQIVTVTHPHGLLGDASGYQVFTTGHAHVRQGCDIAEDMASGEQFKMWVGSNTKTGLTSRPGTCSGNGIEPSVVTGECPNLLGFSPHGINGGSLLYPASYKSNGKKNKCMEEGTLLNSGLRVTEVELADLPVHFPQGSDSIVAFSNVLRTGLPDLRTGRESVVCENNTQQSLDQCGSPTFLSEHQTGTVTTSGNGDMTLTGTGQIYNFFNVVLPDWCPSSTSQLIVNSPGFVFVNVVDNVNVVQSGNKFNIHHEFSTIANPSSYQCTLRSVVYGADALGSGYLQVNMYSDINDPYNLPDAVERSGFLLDVDGDSSGSVLVANKGVRLNIHDATLAGGQLLLAGGSFTSHSTQLECGLFAANTPC